ncbi:hypothetical protein CDD81_1112 [Ophiocordyceps australis]|uniref:RING-type domain-containing protein n=1 Tax=Ophiocordyceps australis TaxID=1399860 RepID=A0A2C5XU85_9HYPO|nr:hypothetical protein CDD81_1112 [Ophiocordyceps australis]
MDREPDSILSNPHGAPASGLYHVVAWAANATSFFITKLIAQPPLEAASTDSLSMGASEPTALAAAASASSSASASLSSGQETMMPASRLSLDGSRGLSSVFNYAVSKWALSCVAMAIILNRTHIFAATRRRLHLRWPVRLAVRLVPVVLLTLQVRRLLQSIQCQTSSTFVRMYSANATFSRPNPLLNALSSALLLGATDEHSCTAFYTTFFSNTPAHSTRFHGSLSLLWPLFGTFCLSHLLETLMAAVQGLPMVSQTGMTLFEQSLAFAEADAAVMNQLGRAALSKASSVLSAHSSSGLGPEMALSGSAILTQANAAPEVLLVALLSSMAHISSHVLGIFDLQAKHRLFNTGFWAICFMASIIVTALSFDPDDTSSQGLLRFPTVCIISFIPHVLVLAGVATCLCIYFFGLLLSALAPPVHRQLPPLTFRQRFAYAQRNMQANLSISDIRITADMDFYTALLRMGFAAMTMASEAVYLNEDRGVSLKKRTWLEEARLRDLEELQRRCIGLGLPGSRYDQIGTVGLIPIKDASVLACNGYNRERAAQVLPKGRSERGVRVGTGATERSSRWIMALEFLLSIWQLMVRVAALSGLWALGLVRIRARPAWLLWLARRSKSANVAGRRQRCSQDVSLSDNQQTSELHRDERSDYDDEEHKFKGNGLDVEEEFRRVRPMSDEEALDQDLYVYWLNGGWWGSRDSSGDFNPMSAEDDWDATSVVSVTSDEQSFGTEWESESDGQKTPTQASPLPRSSRGNSPYVDSPLGINDLARLLRPTNRQDREEALTLATHLQTDKIMTRARFSQLDRLRRARVLATSDTRVNSGLESLAPYTKLGPDEEERLLEQLLLSHRRQSRPRNSTEPLEGSSSDEAAEGRPCVVCQTSMRTIIVWPCRCLSLCDDCRVSLAMNNFDKCVCCRRDVMSFSRIFVP